MVRMTGVEPARLPTLEPKSSASPNFATSAKDFYVITKLLIGNVTLMGSIWSPIKALSQQLPQVGERRVQEPAPPSLYLHKAPQTLHLWVGITSWIRYVVSDIYSAPYIFEIQCHFRGGSTHRDIEMLVDTI